MGWMQAPLPSSQPPPPAPTATEVVRRPDPGIARGKWEAPPWLFWAIGAAVLVGAAVYLMRRLGMLRFGKKKA